MSFDEVNFGKESDSLEKWNKETIPKVRKLKGREGTFVFRVTGESISPTSAEKTFFY